MFRQFLRVTQIALLLISLVITVFLDCLIIPIKSCSNFRAERLLLRTLYYFAAPRANATHVGNVGKSLTLQKTCSAAASSTTCAV